MKFDLKQAREVAASLDDYDEDDGFDLSEAASLLRTAADIIEKLPVTACGEILLDGVYNLYYLQGNQQEVSGPHHCEMRYDFTGPQQWHTPSSCYISADVASSARNLT